LVHGDAGVQRSGDRVRSRVLFGLVLFGLVLFGRVLFGDGVAGGVVILLVPGRRRLLGLGSGLRQPAGPS
jgi:hypothetical protein